MNRKIIHRIKSMLFSKGLVSSIMLVVLVVPYITIGANGNLDNPLKTETFSGLIQEILKIITLIGTPIAALFLVYAGFSFVTSQGDPKKLDTAKSMFWWTVIGTAIIVGAQVILAIITATVGSFE